MSVKEIHIENHQQADDDVDNDKENPVNEIPNEILAKIFMLLPIDELLIMEEVCNRWMEACRLAWRDIEIYKSRESVDRDCDEYMLTQLYVEKILSRCGEYLKELSLSRAFNSSIMKFIADHCKNLTTLEFQFNVKTSNNASDYFQAFTQLDKLKIIKIKVYHTMFDKIICLFDAMNSCLSKDINEIHLSFFNVDDSFSHRKISPNFDLKKYNNLHKLSLRDCIIKNMIQEISEMTKLVYLDIHGFKTIRIFDITKFDFRNSGIHALSNLQYLEHLNLSATKIPSDSDLIVIACKCVNLNYLNIENMCYGSGISTNALLTLTNLKNLKTLIVNWNRNVTDHFIKSLRGITTLHCFGCERLTDIGVIEFIKNCPDLKSLVIGLDHGLTNEIIVSADHVTRDRTNNIILRLKTYCDNEKVVDDYVIKSQWLAHLRENVETINKQKP
ncbi:F-box/LRR-repeat protein fbxl-1-like [Aphidius gifuensis]|uniref:F-box/LRR-repeat protein fbxl-1-like n=1 Tax=Aphidius gifuensis TaxID=684658 RepID=UPI001CDCF0E5|nr:F-box/LRR-repeat protein fbxl-1-like [Aphidius gifuensis]